MTSTTNYATQNPNLSLAYFALCVIAAIANAVFAFAGDAGPVSPTRWLAIGFGFIALLPLYGYVRQRAVPPKACWFAVYAMAIFIIAAVLAVAIAHASWRSLLAIPAVALAAPYLLALRQYLYESPHIWSPQHKD